MEAQHAFKSELRTSASPKMLALTLLASLATANAYVWPSPKLDALEAMRWDQSDTFNGMEAFILDNCQFFLQENEDGSGTGRSNAADWIRTVSGRSTTEQLGLICGKAYHDMATHNVKDGTGGLDASIRFAEEQSRPEVHYTIPATPVACSPTL
jgi:hypothetical protein